MTDRNSAAVSVRPAVPDDLPALTDIYNHYVLHTMITFDAQPFTVEQRREWFAAHAPEGRHRLFVAESGGRIAGYATTSRFRPKPGYDTTVESSVYCHHESVGRGVGTKLYETLFASIADQDVHRIVAGVGLPNPPSVALHLRFGFKQIGVFSAVGRKLGRFWDVAWFERPLHLV